MTCRHSPGDPSCSSNRGPVYEPPKTPDATKYTILDVAEIGPNLVLRVLYPNCAKCSFEGKKVLVFLNVSPRDALKWKEIDPHFRPNPTSNQKQPHATVSTDPSKAPSPSARFPSSPEGWADALSYAQGKV